MDPRERDSMDCDAIRRFIANELQAFAHSPHKVKMPSGFRSVRFEHTSQTNRFGDRSPFNRSNNKLYSYLW